MILEACVFDFVTNDVVFMYYNYRSVIITVTRYLWYTNYKSRTKWSGSRLVNVLHDHTWLVSVYTGIFREREKDKLGWFDTRSSSELLQCKQLSSLGKCVWG